MATEFNLPGSSYEEIQKIVKGYSHASDTASLADISKLVGLHETIVSRNTKFLIDLGLLTSGKYKGATELGRKLGRALEHNQSTDFQRYWREAVQSNEKVSGLITTIRIKGGMAEKDFASHVLYVSGQKNTSGNKTGARCVTDVLLAASLIREEGGKLQVASSPIDDPSPDPIEATSNDKIVKVPMPHAGGAAAAQNATRFEPIGAQVHAPQVVINIQLQIPETENYEVYEKLFKALKENLFPIQPS